MSTRLRMEALASASAALLALLTAGGAAAQTASGATTAKAAAGPELEEIVVTGEPANRYGADTVQSGSFRGATAIETPQTVSVISSAVLKSQQAVDLIDAVRNTAGVASSSNGPAVYNNITIRGISVDTRSNFKLDGSLNILSSIAFPLEDKDRVEVLKGASALYYGFSNPSGIVNFTMKRPTQSLLLSGTAFGDDHGGAGGAIDFGDSWGPFGARLNGVLAHLDTGVKFATGERHLLSGAFDYRPTDKLTLTADVEQFEKKLVEPATFRFSSAPASTPANPYPPLALPPLLDPKSNFGPSWATNDAKETNLLGKANYKFSPAWDVTAFIGESDLHRKRFLPTLNPTNLVTGAGTLTVSPQNAHFKNLNYGAEVAGTFGYGPFVDEILFGAQRAIKDSHAPSAKKTSFAQNFFDPVDIPDPHLALASVADTTRIDDVGYYVFDRLKFRSWLEVLGGVRKSDYTESDQTTGVTTFHATPTSYSYAVIVTPRKWASVYYTYIQGLESTPLAPTTTNNANQQLPPTESEQREAGVKIEPWKGLLAQAAYFDIRRGSTYVNSANVFVQDGVARYRGVEFSLTGEITRNLSLYASATTLSAKQDSGAPTTGSGASFAPTAVGKRIEATPRVTESLALEYDLSDWIEGLRLNGGVYHVGTEAVNALNQAFTPAYTTYDLGASYTRDIGGRRWVFRLNGQNVGNARYWASTGGLFLGESLPGTVKFSVNVSY
jgi:iron complex outermembrane receptor protein